MESAWVTCPSCQLKHRSRPEGTCPRCGGAIGAAPAAEDLAAAPPWNAGESVQASGSLPAGTPSGLGRGRGLLGVGLCVLLVGAGLYALRTRDLFDVLTGTHQVKDGVITGRNFPYRMNVPGAAWRMRSEESAAKDNPLVDRWLMHSKTGANLLLIGEEVPAGSQVNLDAFGKAVVNNLRKGMSVFETQSPVCDNFGGIPTCVIRGSGSANMMAVEYEIRVFSTPGAAYQFIAFGPTESFVQLQDELRQAAKSFTTE